MGGRTRLGCGCHASRRAFGRLRARVGSTPNAQESSNPALPEAALCRRGVRISCRQLTNRGQDSICDLLELGVNFSQRSGWLKNVEVLIERNLISDLRLVVVNPRIWNM